MGDTNSRLPNNLQSKKTPIDEDYILTDVVLGKGVSGHVIECISRKTGTKYALKVS